MTYVVENTVQCACCHRETSEREVVSATQFGAAGLDGRPAPHFGNSVKYWINRCEHCGYCAPSLDEGFEGLDPGLLSQPWYQVRLNDPELPEEANSFLCWALLAERSGDALSAFFASVHAAWICDDEGAHYGARRCRILAISRNSNIEPEPLDKDNLLKPRRDNPKQRHLMVVDLLRRAGRFEEARDVAEVLLRDHYRPIERCALLFQMVLAKKQDTAPYTYADVPHEE